MQSFSIQLYLNAGGSDMVNTLLDWFETHQVLLRWSVTLSVVIFLSMFFIIPLSVIWLPRDYLTKKKEKVSLPTKLIHQPWLILKNILGGILIIAGLAMLFLPGQGLLTLAMGLSLTNIPGKRRIVRRIILRPRVIKSINWLRTKAGKPRLEIPEKMR